jgi:hypothetical protein
MGVNLVSHIRGERLRLNENRVLKNIFGPKWRGEQEVRGSYIMRNFTVSVRHSFIL